jgi:L-fuculose-phosphate aldolase
MSEANDLRAEVAATAIEMSRRGLSPGRSGNVSRRYGSGMLITPSAKAYASLTPGDIVAVAANGAVTDGAGVPSSEWRFHLAVYAARSDVAAIVHTHSMHATVLACAHMPIPAFHYMVASVGGSDIPLVPYATWGTEELARHVVGGLEKRDACLMANHGQIAVGRSCAAALELAAEVEVLAEQYYKVLTVGPPHLLTAAQMTEVLERFKGYGRKA